MRTVIARAVMVLVLAGFVAGCRSVHGAEPARKPTLDIWTCGTDDDQRLIACWTHNPKFRETLQACYEVRWLAIPKHPVFATAHGIVRGPTFLLEGKRIGQGFDTSDALLQGLGLQVPPKAPSQSAPPPSQNAPPPSQTDAPPFQPAPDLEKFRLSLLAEVRAELAGIQGQRDPALVSQLQALDARLMAIDSYRPQLEEMRARYMDVAITLKALQKQVATPPVSQAPAPVGPAKNDESLRPSFWARSVRFLGFSMSIAQLLGATAVTGGSFPVAFLALRGLGFFRSRASRSPSVPSTPAEPAPPAQCVLCLRQKGEIDRLKKECEALRRAEPLGPTLAPYETSTFRAAFEEAAAAVVKRYPGADSTLEPLRSMIDQILSSKGKRL